MSLISRSTSTASIHMVTDGTIQTVDTCQGTFISICTLWTFYTAQIALHRNVEGMQSITIVCHNNNTQGIVVWYVIVRAVIKF